MELNILKHIIAFVNKYYRIFANIEIYIDLKSSELFVSYSTILIDLCFVVAIHLFVFKIYSFIWNSEWQERMRDRDFPSTGWQLKCS